MPAILERHGTLLAKHDTKGREKVKNKHLAGFEEFVLRTGHCGGLQTSTPRDIVHYLIHCDLKGAGRAIVHRPVCEFIGSDSNTLCVCPSRLSWQTVRSYKLALKSAFDQIGMCGDFDVHTNLGNPAQSSEVDLYVQWIREEQLQAGVTAKRSTPLLSDKLTKLCRYLHSRATGLAFPPIERLEARRDLAWYTLAFHSAVRNGQLGKTLLARVSYADTSHNALLLNYCWGKTLRDGSTHVVRVPRLPDEPIICPVFAVESWVAAARKHGWPMIDGFLFPNIERTGLFVTGHGDNAAQNIRLVRQLKQCGIFGGESLHGTRSGSTATFRMEGQSEAAVQTGVGWKDRKWVEHYGGAALIEAVAGKSIADISPIEYRDLNERSANPSSRAAYAL